MAVGTCSTFQQYIFTNKEKNWFLVEFCVTFTINGGTSSYGRNSSQYRQKIVCTLSESLLQNTLFKPEFTITVNKLVT